MLFFNEETDVAIFKSKWRKPFSILNKINPIWWFLNEDDPTPTPDYAPTNPQWLRNTQWNLRNPLHNFTFYVIGVSDRDNVRFGNSPTNVFDKKLKWTWSVTYVKYLYLPFISYVGSSMAWYIGWRDGGNFGLKITSASNV